MQSTFIITFIGDDRPGLVEELATTIAAEGGNWQESRLSQLAGKFAGLIQVSLPAESGESLESALKKLHERGISVRVTAADSGNITADALQTLRLAVIGPDRPGIVREISAALARQQLNVVDLHSHVSSAPMSAELLFNATVEAEVPAATELDELMDRLDVISEEMHVDIHLDPDHGSSPG